MTTYRLKAKYYPLTSDRTVSSDRLGEGELTLGDKILMEYAEKSLKGLCGKISFKTITLEIEN